MKAKRFSKLRDELYDRHPESRERVADTVARISEQLGLAELRSRRSQTQAQLADTIGTTQSAVSRLERQQDLLVSTLRDYVEATGGRLRLVADYGDYELDVDLPVLHQRAVDSSERAFRVIWQNSQTRQFVHVGWLRGSADRFIFTYTTDAELDHDFQPFPSFPDLRQSYESTELFPFFAERIAAGARGQLDDVVAALGLDPAQATPVELLARSWGRTPHDTLQIVPEPMMRDDGTLVRYFLVSGVRHTDEGDPDRVAKLVAGLRSGQPLTWREEPDNPVNDRAVRIEADGNRVGWMPDYLLDELHKARGLTIALVVEHANGPDVPWHLRLLCRLEIKPSS